MRLALLDIPHEPKNRLSTGGAGSSMDLTRNNCATHSLTVVARKGFPERP